MFRNKKLNYSGSDKLCLATSETIISQKTTSIEGGSEYHVSDVGLTKDVPT